MPLFEYKCSECNNEFEVLVFGKEEVVCEKCGSKNINKKFSTFSAITNPTSACGSGECSSGQCPMSAPSCPSGMCGM